MTSQLFITQTGSLGQVFHVNQVATWAWPTFLCLAPYPSINVTISVPALSYILQGQSNAWWKWGFYSTWKTNWYFPSLQAEAERHPLQFCWESVPKISVLRCEGMHNRAASNGNDASLYSALCTGEKRILVSLTSWLTRCGGWGNLLTTRVLFSKLMCFWFEFSLAFLAIPGKELQD